MDKVFEKVGRVQPLLYLAVYFACIPLFAVVYWNLPGGFYAPYAKDELGGRLDGYRVSNIVKRALQSGLEARDRKDGNPSYVPDFAVLEATLSSAGDDKLKYNVSIVCSPVTAVFLIELPIVVSIVSFSDRNPPIVTMRLDPDKGFMPPPINAMNPVPPTEPCGLQSMRRKLRTVFEPWPQIATNDVQAMRSFISGYAGDPTQLSQSFSRMLYFSVIVITTVGFGDIIPMTNSARIYVAIEAVSGILLAGLFINALAYRAAQPGPRPSVPM